MSEAMPGSTPYEPLPKHWIAGTAAVVLWVLTIVGAVLDITDHFPRGLVYTTGTAAGCTTVVAGLLWLRHVTFARHGELVEAAGAMERQLEQISAKVGTYWEGYTAGVHDVNGVKTLNATRGEGRRSPN